MDSFFDKIKHRCIRCGVLIIPKDSEVSFDGELWTKERDTRHVLLCSDSCYDKHYNAKSKEGGV